MPCYWLKSQISRDHNDFMEVEKRNAALIRDPLLERVLRNKIPDASEIQLILFQHCNLACNFCGQDHKSRTGLDTIVQKADEIVSFMKGNLKKKHFVNMMGGEIFNDDLPDKVYEDYFRLCAHVDFEAKQMDHEVRFSFATNLIFANSGRVKNFFDKLDAHDIDFCVSTSYDFFGRQNALWSKEVFHQNLELFQEKIRVINVVLTKPSIQKLIQNNDATFVALYEKFEIFFEYFQPERNSDLLMPSDDEILKAFIFLAQNYPKSSPVAGMLNSRQNRMTCYGMNSMTLLPSGEKARCRYLDYKPDAFKNDVNYQSNSNIVSSFLEENECLKCQWFERCTLRCFVQADWKNREKSQICIFKTFFGQLAELK